MAGSLEFGVLAGQVLHPAMEVTAHFLELAVGERALANQTLKELHHIGLFFSSVRRCVSTVPVGERRQEEHTLDALDLTLMRAIREAVAARTPVANIALDIGH